MEIAKIKNGTIEAVGHYKIFFGTLNPPTKKELHDGGFMYCNRYKKHNPLTQKLVECSPVINGEWVDLVDVVNLTDDEILLNKKNQHERLKEIRNSLLNSCSWTQDNDERIILGAKKAAEWDAYRQAVRDVPFNALKSDPRLPVEWPELPK